MPSSSLPGIRAVLFDIDDTLFPSARFSSLARKKAVSAMIKAGLQVTPPQAHAALNQIVRLHGSNFSGHFDLLVKKFYCPRPLRAVAAGVAAYHDAKRSIRPFPGARRTLHSLSRRGFLLAVASEGVALKQWDKLIRLKLDDQFSAVYVVAPGGKTPSFYKSVAHQLRLPPSSILMVGDHPFKDVASAKAAGLLTARLRAGRHAKLSSAADHTLARLDELLKLLPAKA